MVDTPGHSYIKELKKEYGQIFSVGNYIVRKLTLGEFDVLEQLDSIDAEEYIVDQTVLWPQDVASIPPGHVSSIASEVIELSGFMDPASVLEEARLKSKRIKNMMYAFILATQEKYTEEDLDHLTFSELADKVALAENIIEIQKGIYDPTVDMKLVINTEEETENEEPVRRGPTQDEWQKVSYGAYDNPEVAQNFGTATVDDPIAQKLKASLH